MEVTWTIIFLAVWLWGVDGLQFILERYTPCFPDPKAPMKYISLNMSISNNKLRSIGELEVTETTFDNDGIFDFQIRTCPTDKTCGAVVPIQIKEACRYFTAKSVFGNRFGDQFTPQINCPIKVGTYKFNMTINLKFVTRFPGAKSRTMGKLTVMELLPGNRKRTVSCLEATINSKS